MTTFAACKVPKIVGRRLRFPRPENEQDLYDREIQVGFDGSLLFDMQYAYVLSRCWIREDGRGPKLKIDYFHGLMSGIPSAKMCTKKEEDVLATDMISIYGGFTVQRIKHFQRRWRARPWRPSIAGFGLVDC